VTAVLPPGPGRAEALEALLAEWLPGQWLKTPVFGCVLIGGRSRRMGRPKHLLVREGRTWLERTADLLRGCCRQVAIAGAGEVPATLAGCVRLADVPDAEGPLAGILAAMRWAPRAAWLVAACDHPELSAGALEWLLAQRAPGVWAVLPRLPGRREAEPLLACYDFRARARLEVLAERGDFRPRLIAGSPKVLSPSPPEGLLRSWRSANTPDEAAASR
jgi:molybdopterin-guanine dinucleotide biosynthesis protein A